jgi:hypothetical protein
MRAPDDGYRQRSSFADFPGTPRFDRLFYPIRNRPISKPFLSLAHFFGQLGFRGYRSGMVGGLDLVGLAAPKSGFRNHYEFNAAATDGSNRPRRRYALASCGRSAPLAFGNPIDGRRRINNSYENVLKLPPASPLLHEVLPILPRRPGTRLPPDCRKLRLRLSHPHRGYRVCDSGGYESTRGVIPPPIKVRSRLAC